MITLRRSEERFHTKIGWLDSRHTFAFGEHYDPRFLGFRALRVINDDRVAPEQGFDTHPHRDMEIISYVLEGALEHRDSMGNGSVIRPGDVQRMTAGTGVLHSERNPEPRPVHFLQIWIIPEQRGLPPSYEQRAFPEEERRGTLRLVASGDGRDGAVTVHQDVDVYATLLDPGPALTYALRPGRQAWVHVARGALRLDDQTLAEGDGAAVVDEPSVTLQATTPAEVLLFDLA
jgi:quercetin 2,3-dioxygenase